MTNRPDILGGFQQVLRYFSRTDRIIFALALTALVILVAALPGYKKSIFGSDFHPHQLSKTESPHQQASEFLHILGFDQPQGASAEFHQIRSDYGNRVRYHFGRKALEEARKATPWYTPPAYHAVVSLSTSDGRDNLLRTLLFNMDELSEGDDTIGLNPLRFKVHTDENRVPFELSTSGRPGSYYSSLNTSFLEQALGREIGEHVERIHLQNEGSSSTEPASKTLLLSEDDAHRMVGYITGHTRWSEASILIEEISTVSSNERETIYRIRTSSEQEILGRSIRIDIDIDQHGFVHAISPGWVVRMDETSSLPLLIHNESRIIILVVLGILGFILFIFRLVRQQLDLKLARNDAIVTFIAIFLVMLNSSFSDAMQYGYLSSGLWDLIGNIIGSLFSGAGAALLIYMFSSIGSSISHEIWPERVHALNLFRRGYLKNKPVGLAVVRGLSLAVLIPVLPVVLRMVVPSIEILTPGDFLFISDQYPLAFAHVLGESVYAAQQLVFIALLIALTLIRKRVENPWTIGVIGTLLLFGLDLNPAVLIGYANIAGQLFAAVLMMYAFTKYGALTALCIPFFTALWWTFLGGMTFWAGPDQFQLVVLGLVLVGSLLFGLVAVGYGASGTTLPEFVPSYILELANRERMTRELEIARQVQQTFLPVSNPTIEGFELFAACQPASEVGGDYYEFLPAGDHHLAVSIGDVSGKGIQAAFFMTLVKGYTQSLAETAPEPRAFLTRVNSLFYRNAPRGTFVTMIYGILDTHNKTFTMARAGHNPVLVYRASTKTATYVRTEGMALGMVNDDRFGEYLNPHTLHLETGDCILLYTDGYTEAMNRAGELYGEDRFKAVVEQYGEASLAGLVEYIDADVQQFTGGIARHDDMTIMGIRVM